jgi:hypothetical protein
MLGDAAACVRVLAEFRRRADQTWGPAEKYVAGQTATLMSIECMLSVDEVYAYPLTDS